MSRNLISTSRLALASLLLLTAQSACGDPSTGPTSIPTSTGTPYPSIGSATTLPLSATPQVTFLPPLVTRSAPRPAIPGDVDTTLTPTVLICRVSGASCGADTLARFSTDSTAPSARRISITDRAYSLQWKDPPRADTAITYRIVVVLDSATIGYTDFVIVPSGYALPATPAPAAVAILPEQRPLILAFQILMPPESLTVIVEPGVHGSPAAGTTLYRHGDRVDYDFTADSGFTNLLVTVDQQYVRERGRITMRGPHVLVASADVLPSVASGDEWILAAARSLLRSPDPVRSAQRLLDTLSSIDVDNMSERLARVERVLSSSDERALRALDAALAGHTFIAGAGYGVRGGNGNPTDTASPLPPPSSPPSSLPPSSPPPGSLSNRLVPLGRPGAVHPTVSPPIAGQTANRLVYEPVVIPYVNGVLTTPFGALFNANAVARVALAANWNARIPLEVHLIYNSTGTADPTDPANQCLLQLARRSNTLGVNSMPLYMARCMRDARAPGTASQILGGLADFAEAGAQLASIMSPATLYRPADADSVTAFTARWMAEGNHVVFVPHSQGNLMVQQGLRTLASRGRFRPSSDSTCIGAVSLAAPTSDNWPIGPRHMSGIVASYDAILSLRSNHFPQIRTPLGDSAEAQIQRLSVLGSIPGIRGAVALRWAARIHELGQGYLNQEPTRTRIQQALVRSYRSCALGDIVLSPTRIILRTGDDGAFTAALMDLNGEALDGRRTIRWSADTFGEQQRAVFLSGSGQVHGRYVGGTVVNASTSTMTANGGVRVDPAPLSVAVSEALSARWVIVVGLPSPNGTRGIPEGSYVPPPEYPDTWNGDQCIAKREILVANGQSALFSKECTATYTVAVIPIPNGARYDTNFFEINQTALAFTLTGASPTTVANVSGPVASIAPVPGPNLLDRVNVTAWDAGGHLLGVGTGCAHGCTGWPGSP